MRKYNRMYKKPTIPDLQPLRIPACWKVGLNKFSTKDPEQMNEMDYLDRMHYFNVSLLQMSMEQANLVLDLGWYPEAELDGQYGLVLLKDCDWENPLVSYETRNREEVVHKIEDLLRQTTMGEFSDK